MPGIYPTGTRAHMTNNVYTNLFPAVLAVITNVEIKQVFCSIELVKLTLVYTDEQKRTTDYL